MILACGNTLRSDDGIGPWLADWVEQRFGTESGLRILTSQQWTPDLAEDIASTHSAIFIDCSAESLPGQIQIIPVVPENSTSGIATHHVGASELLALAHDLYDSVPRTALLLTIGAGSTDLGEEFSEAVLNAIPEACRLLEKSIIRELDPKETES